LNNKLFIFTSFLIAALLGLLLLLIYWGNKSIELRETLFVDQVNIAVDEIVEDLENDYYCFTLVSDVSLPKLNSFYLIDPSGDSESSEDTLALSYIASNGEYRSFQQMPIMGPTHLQYILKFDFNDIPEIRDDSSLSLFERGVRDYYDQFIFDANGNRLIDTNQLDSLLNLCVTKLYPGARLRYTVQLKDNGDLIFSKNMASLDNMEDPDVTASIFQIDERIPELLLTMEVVNKRDMFSGQAWNIYLSAALLAFISIGLIFLLIRMQLQQKNLLKIQKDFVHGMTHEFNTPLSNIKLVAQNLLKSKDLKVLKSASILEEEAGKLQVGTNLILTTALIEKNELLLQKEDIDIGQLLERTVEKNKSILYDSGIDLDLKIKGIALHTSGDAFHLENVFQNMINNVRKHSEADLLKVETERNNGHVIIKFTDNGKGISVEDRSRIFKKFQSRQNNGLKNGYGLGLYYSRMILELHGGKIELSDNENRGSVFSIQLPA